MLEISAGQMDVVIFKVADYMMSFKSLNVREIIRRIEKVTPVYRSDDAIEGVINLRGSVVTVFDLNKHLSLGLETLEDRYVIVVDFEDELIGVLVDKVDDVLSVDKAVIEPPPVNLNKLPQAFQEGVFQHEEQMVSLLNISEIFKNSAVGS